MLPNILKGPSCHGARWNSPGRRVIYAAETYAGALLEILVHASGSVPRTQGYIEIEIPADLSIEEITQDDVPHWDSPSFETARALGDRWYDERSTPVLVVPSVVTLVERNVLINQEHPDFLRIQVSQPKPVRWDTRLPGMMTLISLAVKWIPRLLGRSGLDPSMYDNAV